MQGTAEHLSKIKKIFSSNSKDVTLLSRGRKFISTSKIMLIITVLAGVYFAWSVWYLVPFPTIKTSPESYVEQPDILNKNQDVAGSGRHQNQSGDRHLEPSTSRQETASTKEMRMIATAYDSSWESCGSWDGKTTASGLPVRRGVVAVDPDVIPLGTRLYVEGYGEALAADTGGAIKGNRIDLYMESREEALNYGIRMVNIRVLN